MTHYQPTKEECPDLHVRVIVQPPFAAWFAEVWEAFQLSIEEERDRA